MSSITFFFLLVPILGIILLAVNFIFAPHNPYQEKNSAFECGFHSFLGQNRMQFSISFYIFGLLFLLFDLEILLIYPFPLSAQFNSLYGLCIMLVFFLVLTLGFAFELGKNALKIDSRQYENTETVYKSKKTVSLESSLFSTKQLSELIFYLILAYTVLSYLSMPYISCTPTGTPVDVEYIRDQIYSIQCVIKENGLNVPDSYLTKQQLEDKSECMEALKDNMKTLKELEYTKDSSQLLENAKRTLESITENEESVNKLIKK